MKNQTIPNHLLGTASALALTATAIIGSTTLQPAAAAQELSRLWGAGCHRHF
ncbi:MAG: hypothetical protein ACLPSF_05925 [Methylocella sp.]